MAIEVRIGMESILNYKRLNYEVWYALAEFIDNSTQSFFANRPLLEERMASEEFDQRLTVRLAYDKSKGVLRISDNAMGMSSKDLERALQIARPPDDTSGRSEFGMGLKTAACWLGDRWTVRTSKLGEPFEVSVEFDVPQVASGATALEVKEIAQDPARHYTIVEISHMHSRLHQRTIGKIKTYLASLYRIDTREGDLDIFWDQQKLTYESSLVFLKLADGTEYKRDFKLEVSGKPVSGWVGVLYKGGRPKAGFATIRRGRVIQGQPGAYRPGLIFGQEGGGSNNLINQRLVGEVHLDAFEVSHTKNAILFQGDEEDELERKLAEMAGDYVAKAKVPRKNDPQGGPSTLEVDTAVSELRAEMESPGFLDLLQLMNVPPVDVIRASLEPLRASTSERTPTLNMLIGSLTCSVYLAEDASVNDPYYVADYGTDGSNDRILVLVNQNHPHWRQLQGSEGVLNFLRHCIYDAVAEWQCSRRTGSIEPDTVKQIKDQYLRLEMQELPE